ncbi:MAG: cell surface protein SprA, partial [Candidatus Zixiibacteriota bacterium]
NATIIRDDEYIERRLFDIFLKEDNIDVSLWSVREIVVYESITRNANNNSSAESVQADALVFPTDTSLMIDQAKRSIWVVPIDPTSYEVRSDRNSLYLAFRSARRENRILGLWMIVDSLDQSGQSTGISREYGSISGTKEGESFYVLKLIYTSDARPRTSPTWELMWRNCYRLPRGVAPEDLDIRIHKGLANDEDNPANVDYQKAENGQAQERYIEILGLDQLDQRNKPGPDNRIDNLPEIVDTSLGLLIFPHRRPFDTDTTYGLGGDKAPALSDRVPELYDYTSLSEKKDASKYFLKVISKVRSSTIRLNRANIIEGSERVTLNGRVLQKGVDYNIDYNFGSVTLMSDEALDPNADLDVEFEYAPFFTLQKKTLLGVRAQYDWNDDFQFGTTVLYKSDKAQERKPRVGQETAKMVILDFDASLKLKPNFLTSLANALPFVQTEAPSNLRISGEIAQSRPNPNVEDVAYIDDFESSQDRISLGTTRGGWKVAAPPMIIDSLTGTLISVKDLNWSPAQKVLWHRWNSVDVRDVWDRQSAQGEGTFQPFRLIFRPNTSRVDTSGADSVFVVTLDSIPDIIDTTVIDSVTSIIDTTWISVVDSTLDSIVCNTCVFDTVPTPSWGGVTRYLGRNRIDDKRLQLFEMRTNAVRGKLHLDFGVISEDLDGDGDNDTEDLNNNFVLDPGEDVGLDGIPDDQENGSYSMADPAADNWHHFDDNESVCPLDDPTDPLCFDDFEFLNGTENNARDPIFQGLPDEELMGDNFTTSNNYFSFVIDLSDSTSDESRLVVGSEHSGEESFTGVWRTWRIAVKEDRFVDSIGSPEWSNVTHARVWFEADENSDRPETLLVANWGFVQSNWRDSVVQISADSVTFAVATVSEEDGTFIPPPDVEAFTDPTTNVTESQRGLLLAFSNLTPADSVMAVKDLFSVEHYSGYRAVEMFVYGGAGITRDDSIQFFFRLGQDSKNFYEYRTLLRPGWDDNNHVKISFDEITLFKDSVQRAKDILIIDTLAVSDKYAVFGNPDLNKIRFFSAGVKNLNADSTAISGDVWLDELRVTQVRRDNGTAGRLNVTGNVADLLTYNFGFQSQDPFFRKLSTATRGGSTDNLGSGRTQTNMNWGARLTLDKFMPRSWGARIPIDFRGSKSTTTPLLRNNSDIVLPDELREEEKNVSESKSISVSESFSHKSGNPLFSLLLNRLTSNVSYNRNTQRSVNMPYRFGENINGRGAFNFGIRKVPTAPIFFWTKPVPILRRLSTATLGLYPSKWNVSGSANRTLSISEDISGNRTSSIKRDFQGRMDLGFRILDNLNATLNYETRRDLSDLDSVNLSLSNFRLGFETYFRQNFGANYDPKLFRFLGTKFTYKATYSETFQRGADTRVGSLSQGWGISGSFDHIQFLGGNKSSRRGGQEQYRRGRGRRKEAEKAKEKKGRPLYDWPLWGLRKLTGWLKPPKYSYSTSYNAKSTGLLERPASDYRFGLTRDLEVPRIQAGIGNSSAGESESYDLSSGFKLLGGITTDVKFRRSISNDIVKRGGTLGRQISTTWPDLNIRIKQFTTLPLIKKYVNKFIDVFQPRTGFSRQTKESFNLSKGFQVSESVTLSYSPLLQINFRLLRDLSLSGSYTTGSTKEKTHNRSDGSLQKETRSSRRSISLTSKYSFTSGSGFSLPLFGRVKIKSTVSIEATVKMNNNLSETSDRGRPFAVRTDKSDFSTSIKVSYNFSRKIKGGLTGLWKDTNDNNIDRKTHLRELKMWVEIRF